MLEEHKNCLFQNENNVVLNENSVKGKPFINRESKSNKIKIYFYSCNDEHEAPSSCNTTEYLSGCSDPLLFLSTIFGLPSLTFKLKYHCIHLSVQDDSI